jgi:hypothetical protein
MSIAVFDVDFDEANRILAPYGGVLRDLIANAIAVERERCAQIAENFNAAGAPIAKAIRQQPS